MKRSSMTIFLLLLVGLVGWTISRSAAQTSGQPKSGRYQVVSSQMTIILFDAETGKTWALVPIQFGEGPEFAWVPVMKFDETEAFKKHIQRLREERLKMLDKKGFFDEKKAEEKKVFDGKKIEEKKTDDFKKAVEEKKGEVRNIIENRRDVALDRKSREDADRDEKK